MEREFDQKERKIADKVAEEILIREKKQRLFVWLFLLIFVLLLSFFSSLVFTKIAYHGQNIGDGIDSSQTYTQSGFVLFSYEEGTNSINIEGALPVADAVGKAMSNSNEYFKFGVLIKINSEKQTKITYEISLTPKNQTLDSKYIRVYLLDGTEEVLVNGNSVNNFSTLHDSTIRDNSKILYKNSTSEEIYKSYTFKMWVSEDYELKENAESFSCYVNVDAY